MIRALTHTRLQGAFGLLALLCAGCGPSALDARMADDLAAARNELSILSKSVEAQRRTLQGMDDRVALLEDKVESAQYSAQAWQRLPVVKLTPAETSEGDGAVGEGSVATSSITQDDLDPESGGESSPRASSRLPRRPVAPPENASRAGNIGVVSLRAPARLGQGETRQGTVSVTETRRAASAPAEPASVTLTPNRGGTDIDPALLAFREGRERYARGDLAGALNHLSDFVERYPTHGFADNALVLMGRCRFERAEYAAALALFRRVVQVHATGNKVPEALLMIGRTQIKLGRPAEGRETLSRLVAMYPDGEAARAATTELDRVSGRM